MEAGETVSKLADEVGISLQRLAFALMIAGIFLDIGQHKEFPTRAGMAKGKGDRRRLCLGDSERLEAIVAVAL